MHSLTTLMKQLLARGKNVQSAAATGDEVSPIPVNPDLPEDFGWGVLLFGNGDVCVCLPPFSPSKPIKAAILVHNKPIDSRYGPASPFVLAVRYADGSSERRILGEISQDPTAKVAGAPSVLVSESDEKGIRHLYSAYVLHPRTKKKLTGGP